MSALGTILNQSYTCRILITSFPTVNIYAGVTVVSHSFPRFLRGHFPRGYPIKMWYIFLISAILATFPACSDFLYYVRDRLL